MTKLFAEGEITAIKGGEVIAGPLCPADQLEGAVGL
jgi:hypothetical protein